MNRILYFDNLVSLYISFIHFLLLIKSIFIPETHSSLHLLLLQRANFCYYSTAASLFSLFPDTFCTFSTSNSSVMQDLISSQIIQIYSSHPLSTFLLKYFFSRIVCCDHCMIENTYMITLEKYLVEIQKLTDYFGFCLVNTCLLVLVNSYLIFTVLFFPTLFSTGVGIECIS